MKKLFDKKLLIEIGFIFFLSLTPLIWFKGDSIIVGHDNVFALNPKTFLSGRLTTWIEHAFGQSQDLIMGTIPIHLIDAVPYILGFDLQSTQKIVYIFWFFMMGLSAYILASVLNKESTAFKLTTALLYQFNFFILQGWWIAERTKFSAYIAFPLILAVFIKVYRGELRLITGIIINSIVFFIFNGGGLYGIPLYGGMFIAVGAFVFLFSAINLIEKKFFLVKRLLLLIILTVLGYIIVNSYYILPAIYKLNEEYASGVSKVGGAEGLLEWANVISANTSYSNLFRLQGIAEWYDNQEHPYAKYYLQNPVLITFSFIFPLFTLLAFVVYRDKIKKIFILYFFSVYIIGIFFAAGSHAPLGFAYNFLLKTFPGFAIFRSPYYKFAPAFFLASIFLIAYFIDYFKGRTKTFFFFGFLIFVLAYHFPFFTVDIFSWREGFSTRLLIPKYVFEFGEWLNGKKDGGRVLVLPPNSPNWQYSAYNWGYLSFQILSTLLSNKSVVVNNDRLNNAENDLVNSFYEAIFTRDKDLTIKLAKLLHIEYLLLTQDVVTDSTSPIPLSPTLYKEIIEEDFRFQKINAFDKWIIYKIDIENTPEVFVADTLYSLLGEQRLIGDIYNLSTNEVVALKDDLSKVSKENDSFSEIYSAKCLVCRDRDRPFIRFPDRNILADSPLYQLVLFNEKRSLNKSDTKSLIYDYLGITLKRISELREEILRNRKPSEITVSMFEATLRLIQQNFNKLQKYEDKLLVASDLNFYLKEERGALSEILGVYVVSGQPVEIIGKAISAIDALYSAIEPYLYKLDPANNKFYEVEIKDKGEYTFYLKKSTLKPFLEDDKRVMLSIDGKIRADKEIGSIPSDRWENLGNISLDSGIHRFLFSFKEPKNEVLPLTLGKTEFSGVDGKTCYTTEIQNFDRFSVYRAKLDYLNDFSSDLQFLLWEEKGQGRKLTRAARLLSGFTKEIFTQHVATTPDVEGITLGLCSSVFNEDIVKNKINLKVQKEIKPTIIIVPKNRPVGNLLAAEATRLSPTEYKISFISKSNPSALVFLNRFDNGWELSEFSKNHFRVEGYANGWLIDKTGEFDLKLTYRPQKIFIQGAIISLGSIFFGTGYLLFNIFLKKKNE